MYQMEGDAPEEHVHGHDACARAVRGGAFAVLEDTPAAITMERCIMFHELACPLLSMVRMYLFPHVPGTIETVYDAQGGDARERRGGLLVPGAMEAADDERNGCGQGRSDTLFAPGATVVAHDVPTDVATDNAALFLDGQRRAQ